jgi:hypothetical protein
VEKASIAYLDTGEIKPVGVSIKELEEAQETAETVIKGITSSGYRASGKSKCNCDYCKICYYLQNS